MVVGLVVEPILDVPDSTTSSVTPSDGTDFAINDLFFRVKATNDTPYQRATAQFQKDQLDTGHAAGDQSLTGWWTRGQFSFHKGAGIVYYDTGTTVRMNEDLTTLNHFADAEGLDPFNPGKVTCQKAWSQYSATVASVSYVSAVDSRLVVLDGTTIKYGDFSGAPTTYVPAGSATVRAATTSPTLIYALLNNGKIASVDPATGTETTLYTGLTTTGRGIWYAKGRLIVSDSNGKWYQLATNPAAPPQAVASTDVIFTGSDWATASCLSDSPGPMVIGNANRVFALTLDSTGTIPTLSAPVQIGELPPGEIISALAYHLGFVVLVTGAGVRTGILSDSGQLTYGPLLVERTSATTAPPATSVGRYGTRVSVVIDNRIIEIDLAQQVGQGLEFSWTGRGTPYTGSETAAGITTLQYSTQIAWANGAIWHSSATDYMDGWVTTGYHRFATLEPKRFDSVRVHGDGTGGTIEVIRVDAGGTETSLFTIDMGSSHVETVPLFLTEATEIVGLKFALAPKVGDATAAPTLLGYQLFALPEPQRQRLIKVPLLLDDVERRQPGRATGRKGSAWSRLSALEDLETTNAMVSFRDFRTGEAGTAYIEQVEVINTTPPSAQSRGFGGGTLYVTLRKLR